MTNETFRPIRRPQPSVQPGPTLIRRPQDSSLFRGWGVTL
jgi:hypothetical protein